MKARVIYNPVAGQRDVHPQIHRVVTLLRQRGWEAKALETHKAGDAKEYAQQAVEEECQLVFSAGGDGTLNEVVNGVVDSNVVVGVLPIGTGNVWAKEIGLPVSNPLHTVSLENDAQVLLDGLVHRIDTARANNRYFLLWAGVGLDAEIVNEVETQYEMKRRWGALPFVMAGATLAVDYPGTQTTLMIDNTTYNPKKVVLVLISNIQSYGGGLVRPASHAAVDDGYLDVYIFQYEGPLSSLYHAFGMLTQQHKTDPQVSYHRARYLRVDTSQPMPIHLDGGPAGETPLEIIVNPKSLNVLVPSDIRKGLFASPNPKGTPLTHFVS
jgi:YegS/Rv2252/BmrU family lipid kinase